MHRTPVTWAARLSLSPPTLMPHPRATREEQRTPAPDQREEEVGWRRRGRKRQKMIQEPSFPSLFPSHALCARILDHNSSPGGGSVTRRESREGDEGHQWLHASESPSLTLFFHQQHDGVRLRAKTRVVVLTRDN